MTLQYIDIKFCRNTTYEGTFLLRSLLDNLRLIRRQPSWLDGEFHTPFSTDGSVEVHTYWPDGSFTFTRNSQSTGFVCDLFPWKEDEYDFLGDKLQYNNFPTPDGWPSWFGYAYRPGVSLLKLEDDTSSIGNRQDESRCVLVSQYVRGLKPPSNRHLIEGAKDLVQEGESKYFDKDGNILPNGAPENGQDSQVMMISKMRKYPLPVSSDNKLLPPTGKMSHL